MRSVIRIFALAAAAVLLIGMPPASQSAHAEVDGSAAVGCEELFTAIDGTPDDAVTAADKLDACDGIDELNAINLAAALADQDGRLEFDDVADGNYFEQIEDDETPLDNPRASIYIFVFVEDDPPVIVDGPIGLIQAPVAADGSLLPTAQDWICDESSEDRDCDSTVLGDGDGVVVARFLDGTADPGDQLTIYAYGADAPLQEQDEDIVVTRAPFAIELTRTDIQVLEPSPDLAGCLTTSDVGDSNQPEEPHRALLRGVVTDINGVELERVPVAFLSTDPLIADIASDPAPPFATTDVSVRVSPASDDDSGAYAIVCAGETAGLSTTVTATINNGTAGETSDSQILLIGAPGDIDEDGVVDTIDNCPFASNPAQGNLDSDPVPNPPYAADVTRPVNDPDGDACDWDADADGLSWRLEVSAGDAESPSPPHYCANATAALDPLNPDTDGDHVIDGAECLFGTDPASAASVPPIPDPIDDFDHDQIPDDLEHVVYGAWDRADTDGDGLNDGLEVKRYWTSVRWRESEFQFDGCPDDTEVASVNGDTVVNILDLLIIASAVNGPYKPVPDIDRSGTVTVIDLQIAASNYTFFPC